MSLAAGGSIEAIKIFFLAADVPTQLLMIKAGLGIGTYGVFQTGNAAAALNESYLKEGETVFEKGKNFYRGALEGNRPFVKYFSSFVPAGVLSSLTTSIYGKDPLSFNFDSSGQANLGEKKTFTERLFNGVLLRSETLPKRLLPIATPGQRIPLSQLNKAFQEINRFNSVGSGVDDFLSNEPTN